MHIMHLQYLSEDESFHPTLCGLAVITQNGAAIRFLSDLFWDQYKKDCMDD